MTKKDFRPVLKEIIKGYIHPFFKKWGFKRKANKFIKVEGDITKICMVYSSRNNYRDDIEFRLEMYIIKGEEEVASEHLGIIKTGRDTWYELHKGVDVDALKTLIASDVVNVAKPWFDGGWKNYIHDWSKHLFEK